MDVDLRDTPAEAEFRAEVRQWLAENLVGEFAAARGVGGPADPVHWEVRLAWERKLAEAKLLNISWPTEYGGRGGTLAQEIVFLQEHATAAAPYWVGTQGRDLFGPTLLHHGSDELKARFLPKITAAEEFWAQGFSEPGSGSDLASLRTKAVRDGDEWVINGQKIWTTFGAYADWLYVLCRTDPDAPAHRGISMLLIPADQPGVDIRPIQTLAGTMEFCEVFFSDARTKADLVVGPLNGGWKVAMGTVGSERLLTTLPYQYMFERELRDLIAVLKDRGRTKDPLVRQKLAEAWIGLEVIRYTNMRMITSLMRTGTLNEESSISKLQWSEWHRSLGELEMLLLGPAAEVVGEDYGLDLFQNSFLTSRAETIYGGANQIQRSIVGERILGLPR
ncbi:putative acyl-CoA dehydrogenase FadE17 [Frankia canadensis]|uniref:Putative acyl-CoA dehydrogenase FadE17 n=1 Tax=Frankia canadensis TaxID=1836972 RepID=A0A2I2KMY5_9ACTN|nr:putative acyl-CoA dehydrogenase FadE17 [Frankia canadensis]SOU54299.1 putative acyl-CoA dehydrogenase FadE17 [Frankia canadensis]